MSSFRGIAQGRFKRGIAIGKIVASTGTAGGADVAPKDQVFERRTWLPNAVHTSTGRVHWLLSVMRSGWRLRI